MRYEEYTAEAICRALNLEGFKDDAILTDSDEWLRVLLTPAFDLEVCITLSLVQNKLTLDCRTFGSKFWHQHAPTVRPPLFVETTSFGREEFVGFAKRFRATSDEMMREAKGWICLDGMGANLVLRSTSDTFTVEANVGASKLLRKYVADLVSMAHGKLPKGLCRNALGQAAKYLDFSLPIDALESPKHVSDILVLGEPESAKELIEALGQRHVRT